MINKLKLENLGPIENLVWDDIGNINLIIGKNASGKTFLIKFFYAIIRSSELFQRGNIQDKLEIKLAEKLRHTFQVNHLGDIVNRNSNNTLKAILETDYGKCEFSFGPKATTNLTVEKQSFKDRDINSLFIPEKEVVSIIEVIRKSRINDQDFSFDDSYFDLADALSTNKIKGRIFDAFKEARDILKEIVNGKVEFNKALDKWIYFKDYDKNLYKWESIKDKVTFDIGIVSEGIKKIAILDTLLGNRYLRPGSIIFLDEPEAALHPKAIGQFLDLISILSDGGIQFFLASHSYFVIKKLLLIAKQKDISIPCLSLSENENNLSDLLEGMPDNEIIDESINLYKEEIDLAFKS